MPIVSSKIISQIPQINGTITITEEHVDADGNRHMFDYTALTTTDINAMLAKHAADIGTSMDAHAQKIANAKVAAPLSAIQVLKTISQAEFDALPTHADPAKQQVYMLINKAAQLYRFGVEV